MVPISPADIVIHAVLAAVLAFAVAALAVDDLHPAWALLAVPVLAVYGVLALRRPLRRRRLEGEPFPERWREILLREVRYYRDLGGEGRRRFERDVRFFIAERAFEGVGGVEITDEIRVLVAAAAAMLLHGRPGWELPRGRTILVYPGGFDKEFRFRREGPLLGQVHGQGPVIISREALYEGWRRGGDGNNVALHELAHLMDVKGGGADGVPSMLKESASGAWLNLVHREMERAAVGRSVLRPYAAANEAEFFAVAVESFFDRPRELRRRHPELYRALSQFFNQDPGEKSANNQYPISNNQ